MHLSESPGRPSSHLVGVQVPGTYQAVFEDDPTRDIPRCRACVEAEFVALYRVEQLRVANPLRDSSDALSASQQLVGDSLIFEVDALRLKERLAFGNGIGAGTPTDEAMSPLTLSMAA